MRTPPTAHDLAVEIVRRTAEKDGTVSHVVRLSQPPTARERLQLMAARLTRRAIVILPHKCKTVDEWLDRYGGIKGSIGKD